MLFRFSLYGFLKNQRYFEPFLVLLLLEKGFSFFLIGLLVAFREVTVNLLEIPSGAVADACGRRISMILSFSAYVVSFLVFALADAKPVFFFAMVFFGVGEAFRSGTHKAMIFEWLRLEGRTAERTRVYGYTRSWSQIGSAVSSLLAAAFVLLADSYAYVFYFAAVPYVLNVINFLGYPKELDGSHEKARSTRQVIDHLRAALADAVRVRPLRRLVAESMGFEGVFEAAKGYLQPVLQALVVTSWALPIAAADLSDTQETALLVGPVYFLLFLLSATGSRNAHRVAASAGSEEHAARRLWAADAAAYAVLAATAFFGILPVLAAAFVALHVLQSVWRPILVSRFDACSRESQGATVLSIESQAQRLATMIVAPLLGWAVDWVRLGGPGGEFWPVGVVGALAAAFFFATARRSHVVAVTGPSP